MSRPALHPLKSQLALIGHRAPCLDKLKHEPAVLVGDHAFGAPFNLVGLPPVFCHQLHSLALISRGGCSPDLRAARFAQRPDLRLFSPKLAA